MCVHTHTHKQAGNICVHVCSPKIKSLQCCREAKKNGCLNAYKNNLILLLSIYFVFLKGED